MSPFRKVFHSRLFRAGLTGLFLAIFGLVVNLSPLGHALEESIGLLALFHLRNAIQPMVPLADVVIVEIDRETASFFDVRPDAETSEWPRSYHAQLVDKLREAGVLFTVFDSVFETARGHEDDILSAAMRKGRNVILAREISVPSEGQSSGIASFRVIPSVPILEEAAIASAVNPVPELESRDYATYFFAFSEYTGGSPTLPATVFLLYALHHGGQELAALLESYGDPFSLPAGDTPASLIEAIDDRLRREPESIEPLIERLHRSGFEAEKARLVEQLLQLYRPGSGDGMIINHYGPGRTLPTCSYVDIVRDVGTRHCSTRNLRSKVAFVGFSADYQIGRNREIFKTVFSKTSMVELLATTFANLVGNHAIRPIPERYERLILLALGGVAGAIALSLSFRRAAGSLVLLSIGYFAISYVLLERFQLWLIWAVPMVAQVLPASFLAFLRVVAPRRSTALDGVVLASDAAGSTAVSGRMESSAYRKFVARYFAAISRIAERHKGVFANQVADSWFGFWATPLERRESCLRACRAALDISVSITRLAGEWKVDMPVRIGLHCGTFVVAVVPNVQRPEHRFVGGDVNNVASRIENLNKSLGTEPPILLSDAVLLGMQFPAAESEPPSSSEFMIRRMGTFKLAGVAEPLAIHHLVSTADGCVPETRRLCERFEAALDLVEGRHWKDALAAFEALVDEYPGDGPARFYLNYLTSTPTEQWSRVVDVAK